MLLACYNFVKNSNQIFFSFVLLVNVLDFTKLVKRSYICVDSSSSLNHKLLVGRKVESTHKVSDPNIGQLDIMQFEHTVERMHTLFDSTQILEHKLPFEYNSFCFWASFRCCYFLYEPSSKLWKLKKHLIDFSSLILLKRTQNTQNQS